MGRKYIATSAEILTLLFTPTPRLWRSLRSGVCLTTSPSTFSS